MPELEVVNIQNKKIGKVQLDEKIFASEVKNSTIHEVVLMQMACSRQGTAAVKTRGMVRGGGTKPWRQKGTGRARHGSSRSPIWRGGGITFGPQPRSYRYSIPKKKYRLALRGVLSDKCSAGEIVVLDDLVVSEPKTKLFLGIMKALGLSKKTLIVVKEVSPELALSSRNISTVTLLTTRGLNVYDLITHPTVLVTKEALSEIQEVWS